MAAKGAGERALRCFLTSRRKGRKRPGPVKSIISKYKYQGIKENLSNNSFFPGKEQVKVKIIRIVTLIGFVSPWKPEAKSKEALQL